jgi:hypothetical protein
VEFLYPVVRAPPPVYRHLFYIPIAATMSTKVQKPMTQPINLMFRYLQNVCGYLARAYICALDSFSHAVSLCVSL